MVENELTNSITGLGFTKAARSVRLDPVKELWNQIAGRAGVVLSDEQVALLDTVTV